MPFIDLRDLVAAILTIIFISMSIGKFDQFHDFARKEAVKTLHGWPAYRFFPPHYGERKIANHP